MMNEERQREFVLKEVAERIATLDHVCHSPEVMQLFWKLQREHHAYPQLIVNVEEN